MSPMRMIVRRIRAVVAGAIVAASVLSLTMAQAAEPAGARVTAGTGLRMAEPPNFSLTTETCPVCSPSQLQLWTATSDTQLRVRALDPVGPFAGYWPAERYGVYDNWFPQSVSKRTLCGILDHFNFYDGYGDEADWNNFTRPDPAFRYLIDEVAARHAPNSEWHRDSAGRLLMESEVTPDEHFYENPWFPKSSGQSPIEGNHLCAYGAWIAEKVHNYRPEIHPAEMYWWRSRDDGYLLAVEDDSNRFDRRGDYDFDGDSVPSWWRAWSAVPRTATFEIAFHVRNRVLQRPGSITINEEAVRNNVLADSIDATDGTTHGLEYNGRVLINVIEQLTDNRLRVDFVRLCRDALDRNIRGYVRLTTKVGVNDRGGEGYHLLRFTETPQSGIDIGPYPPIGPAEIAPVLLQADVDRDSIGVRTVGGKMVLVGDVVMRTLPTGRTRANDLIVRSRGVASSVRIQQPPFRRSARAARLTVPISVAARAEVRTSSGRLLSLPVPQVSPAPEIDLLRVEASTAAPDLWPLLARSAGGGSSGPVPPGVLRSSRMTLSATARYAMLRDGQVAREEGSPFSEVLSEALQRPVATRRVFGTVTPARLTWSFVARDLATGGVVPVSVDTAPTPGSIAVTTSTALSRPSADFRFPDEGAFEVTAALAMRDVFGKTNRIETTLSNVVVSSPDKTELVRTLVRTAATVAGVSAAQLLRLGEQQPSRVAAMTRNARLDRAQAIRALALQIARDRIATVAELRLLARAARLFRSTR